MVIHAPDRRKSAKTPAKTPGQTLLSSCRALLSNCRISLSCCRAVELSSLDSNCRAVELSNCRVFCNSTVRQYCRTSGCRDSTVLSYCRAVELSCFLSTRQFDSTVELSNCRVFRALDSTTVPTVLSPPRSSRCRYPARICRRPARRRSRRRAHRTAPTTRDGTTSPH
eukprot:gene13569-biopygen9575